MSLAERPSLNVHRQAISEADGSKIGADLRFHLIAERVSFREFYLGLMAASKQR